MDKDWVKLMAAWLATIGGYVTEHFTAGRVVLILTGILTALQCYKVWLDIRMRRRQLQESRRDTL